MKAKKSSIDGPCCNLREVTLKGTFFIKLFCISDLAEFGVSIGLVDYDRDSGYHQKQLYFAVHKLSEYFGYIQKSSEMRMVFNLR